MMFDESAVSQEVSRKEIDDLRLTIDALYSSGLPCARQSSIADRHLTAVARAFDAAAPAYGDLWDDSVLGRLQREAVWRVIDHHFPAGSSILDLGCGTGADARHLARRGVRVRACDVSDGMIRLAQQKTGLAGLSGRATFELRAIEELSTAVKGSYDGALSNFGALNCVPDPRELSRALARLIRPGGRLILCVIGKHCLSETAWFVLHGKFRKAARRWNGKETIASLGTLHSFPVFYHSAHEVVAAFEDAFRLTSSQGVGLLVPPSYLEPWARRAPSLFRGLALLDRALCRWPLLQNLADHRLLVFVRNESI